MKKTNSYEQMHIFDLTMQTFKVKKPVRLIELFAGIGSQAMALRDLGIEFECYRLNMGHGFRTNGKKVGWKNDVQGRERAYASQDWCNLPDKILQAAERLRGVQIENMPALDLIKRFNYKNVLIYCDPPYMLETRNGKQYRCEMGDGDHEELLRLLLQYKGFVLISGYDTELYRDMLAGWTRYEATAYSQVCSKKKEVLWMNFNPYGKQMCIDDYMEG